MFKYKNISKKGSYKIKEKGKIVEKQGTPKQLKINGEFITVNPGENFESVTRIFEEDLQLVEEEESETKEEKQKGNYSKTDLVDMKKAEQVAILVDMDLDMKEINKLSNEEKRVNKILELQK